MSVINISNLTFAYDGSYDNVFDDVSFQIDSDWRLGLIGRNGRGKTTLLRLLLSRGGYDYSGTITKSVSFDYFPFELADKSQYTLEIIEGIAPEAQGWQISRELSLLDVCDDVLERSFETLSNGEQTKVLLAALFLKDNNFLLIDEPTNHLDADGRAVICEYLKSKKGFILVSHDRFILDNCINHVLSINRAGIEVQKGNFSSWLVNKQRRDNHEIAENERLQKDIKKLEEAAKRTAGWSDKLEKTKYGTRNSGLRPDRGYIGHKSAKMMKRSKAIETRRQSAAEEKTALLKNIESADALKITPLKHHSNRLVTLENLSVSYNGRVVCAGVNFTVEQGQRLSLSGKNGCGKSSILKLICGHEISYTGQLQTASGLIISYVGQETSFLAGNLSDFTKEHEIDESLFKAILRKLDFSRNQFEKDVSDFSAGQKKKVLIAKSLCEKAHLYIWDEPLNFIDVLSRIQIEELLSAYAPTMIFVEHDSVFSEKIASDFIRL
ncbi:MAG: ABC-F type ribosomal protection protein [Oscillospiraceae bacterium]|nr:ABC-F type ribosomal protection protein [Oscillospiraceae bacterium]